MAIRKHCLAPSSSSSATSSLAAKEQDSAAATRPLRSRYRGPRPRVTPRVRACDVRTAHVHVYIYVRPAVARAAGGRGRLPGGPKGPAGARKGPVPCCYCIYAVATGHGPCSTGPLLLLCHC